MKDKDEHGSTKLPKGAYRVPGGGYVTVGKPTQIGERSIRVVAVHRDPPDMEKLVRALLMAAGQTRLSTRRERKL
jgi:hypothetical protein